MKNETAIRAAIKALTSRWTPLGVEIDAHYDGQGIRLPRIVVRKEQRSSGLGTLAMEDLVGLADRYRLRVTLSPATDFGGSSVERLKKFYRRFGFVNNKGRHKDFTISDSMYRLAKG